MFKKLLLMPLVIATLSGATALAPAPVYAIAGNPTCAQTILTLPVWYRYLAGSATCMPRIGDLSDIWIIALNVVEMALQAVAYVAVGLILWGGFKYILSRGDPGETKGARVTITNAIIGLLIALGSVAIVNFIAGAL